jgi:thiamine-monophosphate kinase
MKPGENQSLQKLGEDAVVALLCKGLPLGPQVRAGAGDDCAVIGDAEAEWWQLLKTDAVVEGVHFTAGQKAERVGWKALCRAISDIAAMGGIPECAMITVALPGETAVGWVKQLYAGLRKAARRYEVSIVGGETVRSLGGIFINVALTGRVERQRCVLRSGGRPEDVLFVTGRLGGSKAGKHLDFTPRLAEARWLVERARPTAMMDLSDGLGTDLPRLARASGCGYELNIKAVPRTRGYTVEQALGDGEDFELLLAVPPEHAVNLEVAWRKRFVSVMLTRIGRLTDGAVPIEKHAHGYDHFA